VRPRWILPLIVLAFAFPAAAAAQSGEFDNPSWTALPAATAANTTPSCPLTADDDYQCQVPDASLPPQDSSNPERYLDSAYWPAEKRPDIEIYAIQKYGYGYENCASQLPHYCFLTDAQAVGYPISHTPAVGDLWVAPGECLAWGGSGGALPSGCTDSASDWYIGYVEQVFPDGSFIQSWGGSATTADSGLSETWFSGAMDASTDFIGLMPAGTPLPAASTTTTTGTTTPTGTTTTTTTTPAPSRCVVPRLLRRTLAQARLALSRAHCRLGRVTRPRHVTRHHVLRVWRQSPATGSRHAARFAVAVSLR
jgi:hypothetical protein